MNVIFHRAVIRFNYVIIVCTVFTGLMFYASSMPGAQEAAQDSLKHYLFSYFKGNGEDGLHLASSVDGLTWQALNQDRPFLTPFVGKEKLMRDPCIVCGPDSLFHMVWTTSWTDQVIGYANSADLITWSGQKAIPVMAHEPTARNCWAPELFYDDVHSRYLICWSTTIPGRFQETDNSSENGYNHRIYFTTTSDFETFSPTHLLYDPGFNSIDATIIKSGSVYLMFFKDETLNPPRKNIRWAPAWQVHGPYGQASGPITGDYWAEGPMVMMIDDMWYVFFDKYRRESFGAVRSGDLKQWEDISSKVSFPDGARHGTVFKVSSEVLKKLTDME